MPTASVLAASLLERVLDLLTVVVLFGVYVVLFGALYTPASERGRDILLRIQDYSIKSFVVVCLLCAVLVFVLRTPRTFDRIPWKIRRHLLPFLEGFRGLMSRGGAFKAAMLSLAIWMSIVTQLWFFTRAYIDGFPYAGTLVLMVLTVVGVAIPTPAGVGGFQFFMNLALVHLFAQYLSPQDPQSQAAGISNGTYLASMLPAILLGLVFLNYEGLTLGRMTRLSERESEKG